MPKLTACFSKKLPTGQYSNDTFSASIEAEVQASDAASLQAGLRRLFALAKEAVDQQFAGTTPSADPIRPQTPQKSAPPIRNGTAASNGRHVPATQSQKKAVFAISKSLGIDPAQFQVEHMSLKAASQLIDGLKSQQAGN
jgi:hypothetical protein